MLAVVAVAAFPLMLMPAVPAERFAGLRLVSEEPLVLQVRLPLASMAWANAPAAQSTGFEASELAVLALPLMLML